MNAKRSIKPLDKLDMRPSRTHIGIITDEIQFALGESLLGPVLVAASAKGVVAISIGEDADQLTHELQRLFPKAHLIRTDRALTALVKQVASTIRQPSVPLDFPLDIRGTAFQKRVWSAVQKIPLGKTSTYAEIARRIGAPRAMRAVGSACAINKLSLAIPCHRVLRSGGSLSGGFWGIDGQRTLLDREAAAARRRKPSTNPKLKP